MIQQNSDTKSPVASIIIPTYNRALVIDRAIQSVLDQTLQDFEIIICDDASTDDTEKVIRAFRDDRIHYVKHDFNKFAAAARNTAMKLAIGKYIAFLDSDDAWHPKKLELQIRKMEALDNSWGCIFGAARIFKDGSSAFTLSHANHEGSLVRAYLLGEFVIVTSTFLFRRICLEKIGFMDERLKRNQDKDFYIRLIYNYKMASINAPVADMFLETNKGLANITVISNSLYLEKQKNIIAEFDRLTRRRIYARHDMMLAGYFLKENRTLEGLSYCIKGITAWPFFSLRMYGSLLFGITRGLLKVFK